MVYVTEMPSYFKTVPSDPDANGGTLATVIGKKLMNVSTAAVRLRATRGLLIELSRLQQERSAIQRAIVAAGVAERDLRSRATRTDVFDATELRRMEREAYEEPMWLNDHRRRPEGEYLNISERINRAKIEKTEKCLQSGHTYVIPSLYASESALTFVWPKMCVSDVELLVEIDITHNLPAGEWAYQMDVLNLYTYNQSRYPEPAAQILDLDRRLSAVNTLNDLLKLEQLRVRLHQVSWGMIFPTPRGASIFSGVRKSSDTMQRECSILIHSIKHQTQYFLGILQEKMLNTHHIVVNCARCADFSLICTISFFNICTIINFSFFYKFHVLN